MHWADAAGGEPGVEARVQKRRPQRTGGAPRKGKGRANRHGWSAAEQGPLSSLILPRTPREGGGAARVNGR